MKPLRVLSIDWDYLVNATMKERMTMFPDGGNENLPNGLLDYIWMNRYADYPKLSDIDVDKFALNYLKNFIQRHCNRHTQIMVADSHRHIFNMVYLMHVKDQPVTVINVDFHHDCYGSPKNPEVDCGNWVTQMFVNGKNKLNMPLFESQYLWVKREDSDEPKESYSWSKSISIKELGKLEDFTLDVLFICRSGTWSPPHLDRDFIKFAKWCMSRNELLALSEEGILNSRYNKKFHTSVNQLKEQMTELRKCMETQILVETCKPNWKS